MTAIAGTMTDDMTTAEMIVQGIVAIMVEKEVATQTEVETTIGEIAACLQSLRQEVEAGVEVLLATEVRPCLRGCSDTRSTSISR